MRGIGLPETTTRMIYIYELIQSFWPSKPRRFHIVFALYYISLFYNRVQLLILSKFIHHPVIEKKKNKPKQYTINTKIQSICNIDWHSVTVCISLVLNILTVNVFIYTFAVHVFFSTMNDRMNESIMNA